MRLKIINAGVVIGFLVLFSCFVYGGECDPNIGILLDKLIFEEGETIYFTPVAYETSDYNITYWIEDLEGNIVKNKIVTKNSNQKQWTPKLEKEEQVFLIKANLTYFDCEDMDLENNFKEQFVAVFEMSGSSIGIRINELLPDPDGYDDASMPEGEFVELYNYGDDSVDLEGFGLKDNYGSNIDLFVSDSNTIGGTTIEADGYLVVYMNGRYGFLNNDDFEKITLYDKEGFKIDEVSYSGSDEDSSWSLTENGWILGKPSPGESNFEENKGKSFLEIEKIYLGSDEKGKWGDNILVRVNVYKGNSSKKSMRLYFEDFGKQTKFNLDKRYKNYTLTVPVEVIPNCNQKFEDGEYDLILKGLDEEIREEVEIEDFNSYVCDKRIIIKNDCGKVSYSVLEIPSVVEDEFDVEFKIENNMSETKDFEVWSYVYDGGDILSAWNKKNVTVPRESSMVVNLENELDYIEDGDYNFKVKVQEEGKKTAKQFTSVIEVDTGKEKDLNSEVFKSNNEDIKRAGIYFLCALLIMLIMVVLRSGK